VEGPSDELIVQRAYLDAHGKLPIMDGVDVIDVGGLSAKRFLDIAKLLKKRSAVVTDNDGVATAIIEARFADYAADKFITIHVGKNGSGNTLEPQLLSANTLSDINAVVKKSFVDEDKLLTYMASNKTSVALAIFESASNITMPEYIVDAIAQ
jgi:putative ATP-dependent endonuclease of OLD family